MKVTTMIKKLFGEHSVCDYMDTLDSEDRESILEYWSIECQEDASEPDYFLKLFTDGLYQLKDINDKLIISTYKAPELKKALKVLAEQSN